MCNSFDKTTPWEISTLRLTPISIRLIQGEIKTNLQYLLIEPYFNTYTDQSINDITKCTSEMFSYTYSQGRGFPMSAQKKTQWMKKLVMSPDLLAGALHGSTSSP